jgi:two-component system, LytTR family, response regulator LytT
MNLLLVEDEPLALKRIRSILEVNLPDWNVVDTAQSVKELELALFNIHKYDLIVCDIHLADGLCFKAFKGKQINIPVIFVTAYDQYALQSFEYNGIDYVLKPIEEERLLKAFDKVKRFGFNFEKPSLPQEFIRGFLENYSTRVYKKRFLTKIGTRFSYVMADSVAYFYAEEGITYLVESGNSQKYMIDHSLNELQNDLLDPNKFYRINRSMIINLDNLIEMKPYHNGRLVLYMKAKSEEEIIVARERVNEFKSWINQ